MRRLGLGMFLFWCSACSGTLEDQPTLTREALLDPNTCKDCHPDHYREWSGSMHAYAAEDPVFRAMNARGQEETGGDLGSFCVNCHAPMAVEEGATADGLNLDDVPKHLQGVTCYFCHNVQSVEGTHNNPLVLANDTTMRGGVYDPVKNTAHSSAYSELLHGLNPESSKMCGACHDIVVDKKFSGAAKDVHLERTYTEFLGGLHGNPDNVGAQSCAKCHMAGESGEIANYDGVKTRKRHGHEFPGIDVAITDFPEKEAQLTAVRAFLNSSMRAELCVGEYGTLVVTLDNFLSGHKFPSGASQDRRFWIEAVVYKAPKDGTGSESVHFSTGVLEPGGRITDLEEADPDNVVLLRDRATKLDGSEAHMFWDVADIDDTRPLKGVLRVDAGEGFLREQREYAFPGSWRPIAASEKITRATLRLRFQPIGQDVIDDLVDSGHLEDRYRNSQIIHDILPNDDYESGGPAEGFFVEWPPEDWDGLFDDSKDSQIPQRFDCIEPGGTNNIQ